MIERFTKMHGLGNDFVVVDALREPVEPETATIRRLADRRRGIGCDQVLLAAPATQAGMDFRYRIFNADGSEVEQCGNGVRCLARFLRDAGYTDRDHLRIETLGGPTEVRLTDDGQVCVNMGPPRLDPDTIPLRAPVRAVQYTLTVGTRTVPVAAVSMGNPHAVVRVDAIDDAPVADLGPLLTEHPDFPAGANTGFMEVVARDHIRLRVHERGAGETLACGTGACAAVVAGRLQGLLDEQVTVTLPGGTLTVSWAGDGEPVWMTGPAVTVFHGRLTDDGPGAVR
ncbi:MAG: diaminopimelate epimerase [Ectothiorhodospiraceae bacterium]